eukprot:319068-Pelagomonas_calceolata.AAC.1
MVVAEAVGGLHAIWAGEVERATGLINLLMTTKVDACKGEVMRAVAKRAHCDSHDPSRYVDRPQL